MFTPTFSLRRFAKKLRKRKTPHGVSCSYLQWSTKFGLKMFTDKSERNHSHRGQKRAAEVKLAPKVGKKFEFELISCDKFDAPEPRFIKVYCFFTETASRIGRKVSRRTEEMLDEGLEKIGIGHNDLHDYNVGRLGKRWVVIDFDGESCYIGPLR